MKKRTAGLAAAILLCLCGMTAFAEELPVAPEAPAGEQALTAEQIPPESLTFDGFLTDLISALHVRSDLLNQADAALSEKERAVLAAEKEWETMGKYDGADFLAAGENEEYLRREYLRGLKQQTELTPDEPDDAKFWRSWDEGYLRRAYVLEELYAIYYLEGIPEEITSHLGETTGGYAANGTQEVYQIQSLVGVEADGQTGKKTVLALKKKQEELGLEINGVVNAARLAELNQKLAENGQQP